MSPDIRVSVLIPVYNHASYVLSCLESVKCQDYPNLELLICDDGSSDNSAALIREWLTHNESRFSRVHFVSQNNAGVVKTIKLLVKESTGQFVALCASDDLLTPNSITIRASFFSDITDMVVGRSSLIDSFGSTLSNDAAKTLYNVNFSKYCNQVYDLLFYRWPLVGPVSMYRRELLTNIDDSFIVEDRQIFLQLSPGSNIKYTDDLVAEYRFHPNSISRSDKTRLSVWRDVALINVSYSSRFTGFRKLYLYSFIIDIKMIDLIPNGFLKIHLIRVFRAFRYAIGFVRIHTS